MEAASNDPEYDFYIISDDTRWEKKVMIELQKRREGIRCISRHDWKLGKYKLHNMIEPVNTSKKVVVGFTSSTISGNPEFVATTAIQKMLDSSTLYDGKLIPVRITENAIIPEEFQMLTPANGWEDDVYEKLLHALDGEIIKVKVIQKQPGVGSGDQNDNVMHHFKKCCEYVKENLKLKDIPEMTKMSKEFNEFLVKLDLHIRGITDGSIIFHLSVYDPNALMNLWEIHSSGQLIKDLAKLMMPEDLQEEFLDKWKTDIDEVEYKSVLDKLNEQGRTTSAEKLQPCLVTTSKQKEPAPGMAMMATSELKQFLENVDEKVLECTICFKRLQNPKSLNCLHSFCLACLEDWVKVKGKLTCPTCSKSYPIPEGGLQKLPPNTFLTNLLETIEQFSKKDQMNCVCGKGQAKYYCQECRHYLCSACSDYHKILPVMANHKVHTVKDVQSMTPQHFASVHPPLCLLHSTPLEFYCIDCKIPICVNCTIMDHKEHKLTSISEAFQTFKETSTTLEEDAHHYENKLQDGLKAVIQNATKLEQSKDTSLRDIDTHVQEMVKKIKENGDKLKNKVETIYKKKKKVIDVQMDELRTTKSDVNTKLSLLNQLLKSDEATAMQSSEMAITALKDRINKLPKTKPNDNGQIKFFINKHQIASLQQCIGNVTQLRAPDCLLLQRVEYVTQGQTIFVKIIKTDECEIHANQLKATWTQPTGETNITQVQEDDNGNYVVTGKCTSPGVCTLDVSVDDKPIKQSPMIIKVEKEGLVNTIKINTEIVTDVIKCEDDCLLVPCRANEIHKYKQSGEYIGKVTLPQGVKVNRMYSMKNGNISFSDSGNCITICNMNGQVIKSIGQGVFKSVGGIHVDEASNVVYVTDMGEYGRYDGKYVGGCVLMFDIDSGQIIREIEPEVKCLGGISDVSLTIQGHVLVLYNNRLQLFDNEGRFIKVLVKEGDTNSKVRNPGGVVVDEDDNIIISSHHKLQLFSRNGNFIKRIDKQEDGIEYPTGLSIISYHPRRVAIANNGDKTVKIFNY